MSDETEVTETGHAEQPGETTVEQVNFKAGAIAGLLEEWADEPEPGAAPREGKEIPPKRKPATAEELEVGSQKAEAAAPEDQVPRVDGEEPEVEEQPEPGEAPAKGELTEQEQADLQKFEEDGGELPESLQKLVSKRIGKLIAARDAAKQQADAVAAELQTLRTENEALRSDPKRPGRPAPTGMVDEASLDRLEQATTTFLNDAEAFLDNTATEEERGRVERFMAKAGIDATGLRRQVREVTKLQTTDLPAQREQLKKFRADEAGYTATANQYFGRLNDKTTPEYKQAEEVLALVPELKQRSPNWRLAQGAYVLGLRVFEHLRANAGGPGDMIQMLDAALAAKYPGKPKPGQTAPVRRAPPKPPVSGRETPAARRTNSQAQQAEQRFAKAPTRANAEAMALEGLKDF